MDGRLVGEIDKTNYLAPFGHAPLLPIEDADTTYVVFVELLDESVPPKNMSVLMGSGSKMEPLGDESGVTGGWERVSPKPLASYPVKSFLQDDHLPP